MPLFCVFFSPENIDQKSNKNVQEEDLRFSEQEIGERKTLESLIQVCIPKEDGKIQKTLFENWVEIASWIKTVKNSSEILATKWDRENQDNVFLEPQELGFDFWLKRDSFRKNSASNNDLREI